MFANTDLSQNTIIASINFFTSQLNDLTLGKSQAKELLIATKESGLIIDELYPNASNDVNLLRLLADVWNSTTENRYFTAVLSLCEYLLEML